MATSLVFDPKVTSPLVRVTTTEDGTQYRISWDPKSGAASYRVYGGFDPVHIRSVISGVNPLPSTATEYVFNTPPFPPSQIVYFWVSWNNGTSDVFIEDVGSYAIKTAQLGQFQPSPLSTETENLYLISSDQQYYFEEIRRRAKAILEDTSEEADLFIRQWRGLPEPSAQDALGLDPNYQVMTRDSRSYGVGVYPGFFPAIRVRMRFGALPSALLDFQLPGLRPMLTNEAWTLWEPIVHENDLVIRLSNGIRYVVHANAFSNNRGVPIVQRLSLDVVAPNSPLLKVTDAGVRERWGLVNSADYSRLGLGIASDSVGGPNYLLFD